MGLPARQRRRLENIEHKLRSSDPRLAAMFAIFGRLTRDEDMPRVEELRHRAAILALRMRLWLAAVGSRLSFARRRPGARAALAAGPRTSPRARRQGARRQGARRPASRRWRPMAVFFPLALVLMSASIFVAAKFGSAPRCVAATAVATAKLHPRGKPLAKGGSGKGTKRCRPAMLQPIPIGR
jgi:Protein of unknown function (DUF3040)